MPLTVAMATRTKTTDRERGREELYRSRELRFRDDNHKQQLHLIGVKNGQQLLEVGYGSGSFRHCTQS